jgi:hypothetical protein
MPVQKTNSMRQIDYRYSAAKKFLEQEIEQHKSLLERLNSWGNRRKCNSIINRAGSGIASLDALNSEFITLYNLQPRDLDEIEAQLGGPDLRKVLVTLLEHDPIAALTVTDRRIDDWQSIYAAADKLFQETKENRSGITSVARRVRTVPYREQFITATKMMNTIESMRADTYAVVQNIQQLSEETPGYHGIFVRKYWQGFSAREWQHQNLK